MGLAFLKRQREGKDQQPTNTGDIEERFRQYFPRIFAYVSSCVGGHVRAQDIVVEAFAEAFSQADGASEDRFRAVLFRIARRLCRRAMDRANRSEDPLSPAERDVLALVFDAGLTRKQIATLFRMREGRVSSLLMKGLRKLKEDTSPAAVAAYLKLA